MIKKKYILSSLLIILISSILMLTGCRFFVNNSDDDDDSSGSAKKEYATIGFSISDFNHRAMINPTPLDSDEIVKIVLKGDIVTKPEGWNDPSEGNTEDTENNKLAISKEFTSYADFTTYTTSVYFGEWKFSLEAYKTHTDGTSQKVAYIADKSITINGDGTINFELKEADTGSGTYDLTVKFPYNGAAKVKYKVSTLGDLSDDTGLIDAEVTTKGEGAERKSAINVKDNNIAKGYYFLRLFFYSDATAANLISRNTIYFRIAPGCNTSDTVTLDEINTPFKIIYKDNIDNDASFSCWAAGATPVAEFNKSMDVVLPDSTKISRTGYTFEGWGVTADATAANKVTGWSAGAKTGDVTVYAIWKPITYAITYGDYKALSVSKDFTGTGTDTTGTVLPAAHVFNSATVIPVPKHKDTDNATFLGWYTDAACTTELTKDGTDYVVEADTYAADFTLYAKWAFDHVYFGGTGKDSKNSGYDATHSVMDIHEALLLLKKGNPEATVEIQENIPIDTDTTLELSSDYEGTRFCRAADYKELLFTVENGAALTLKNIIIDGGAGKSIAAETPAVGLHSGAILNMEASIIQNNNNTSDAAAAAAAVHGGGVYSEGTLNLDSDSEIKNNKTSYQGGGVYAKGGSLNGGKVTGNTAKVEGGGIYVAEDLSISGAITVTSNKSGTGATLTDNNLVLPEISDVLQKLIVTGPLTSSSIEVTVRAVPGPGKTIIPFTSDFKTYNTAVTPQTYFVSDEKLLIGPNATGEASLSVTSGKFVAATYDNLKFYLCDAPGDGGNKVSMISTTITENQTLYLVAKLEDDTGATPAYTDISTDVTGWRVQVLLGQTDAEEAGTGITVDQATHSFTIPTGIRADNYAIFVSGIYNNKRYGTTIPLSVANYAECTLSELKTILENWASIIATGDCYLKLKDSVPDLYSDVETDLTLNSLLTNADYEYMSVIVDLTECKGLTTIEKNSFINCNSINKVYLPDTITSIGNSAFQNCIALKTILIENNPEFTTVGNNAFQGARILSEIVLPDSTTSIGDSCFKECLKLDYIKLPDSLTTIGESAFFGCSALRQIKIPSGVTKLPASLFKNCKSLATVTLHKNITELGNDCFSYCRNITSITLPSELQKIGNYCFRECTNAEFNDIPSGVISLGIYCFYKCSKITAITIPGGVTSIPNYCFSGTSLTEITIPNTVTGTLGNSAFESCTSLITITIGSGITEIGIGAFKSCSALGTITIPANIIKIQKEVFAFCENLTSVTLADGLYSSWQYTNSSASVTGTACDWTDAASVANKLKTNYSLYYLKVTP